MKKIFLIAALVAAFALQADDSVIGNFGKATVTSNQDQQEQLMAKKKRRASRNLVGTYCKMVGRCNVRSGPGENYSVINSLPNGYLVYVERRSGDWYYIDMTTDCCDPDCKFYGWTHRQNLRFYAVDDMIDGI